MIIEAVRLLSLQRRTHNGMALRRLPTLPRNQQAQHRCHGWSKGCTLGKRCLFASGLNHSPFTHWLLYWSLLDFLLFRTFKKNRLRTQEPFWTFWTSLNFVMLWWLWWRQEFEDSNLHLVKISAQRHCGCRGVFFVCCFRCFRCFSCRCLSNFTNFCANSTDERRTAQILWADRHRRGEVSQLDDWASVGACTLKHQVMDDVWQDVTSYEVMMEVESCGFFGHWKKWFETVCRCMMMYAVCKNWAQKSHEVTDWSHCDSSTA